MKKSLLLLSALAFGAINIATAQDFEDANTAVANMRIGWNLGNTLDANSGDVNNMWIEAWTERKPENYETSWGQPLTTQELIHMFKEAGFGAIRIPVTWYPHVGNVKVDVGPNSNGDWVGVWDLSAWTDHTIDATWMKRVHEIVDYVIDEGLYCILNMHHDTGAASSAWLRADQSVYEAQKERFESIWQQIATEFIEYDEHLLFEAYNEMLDPYSSWCFASLACTGNYNADVANSAYKAINNYAQSFVDVVRATGGNNAQRNLIVNTYGACSGEGNWSSHLDDPLSEMLRPNDSVDDHIIFEIHAYPSVKNVNDTKKTIDSIIDKAKKYLVSKGCPLIFGEWGTLDANDFASWNDNLETFARYFVELAKQEGMATFYWMGLSDGADRATPKWTMPTLKDAIVKGWYGEGGYDASVIDIKNDQPTDNRIFNLNGQEVHEPLAPGIYISNHKKVLR